MSAGWLFLGVVVVVALAAEEYVRRVERRDAAEGTEVEFPGLSFVKAGPVMVEVHDGISDADLDLIAQAFGAVRSPGFDEHILAGAFRAELEAWNVRGESR